MTKNLGGAGGGGGQPTIVKDNLRSQDSVEFILGLCEGPIAGLVDGPKSFYLNDTPLQSPAGDNNFEAFELHVYHGDANASQIIPKMGGTASNVQVGVELAQFVPVTRTTPQALRGLLDRLEVRIVFNQLVRTTNAGDQLDATAEYRIEYKRADELNWRSFMGDGNGVTINLTNTSSVRTQRIPIGSNGEPTDNTVVTTSTLSNISSSGNVSSIGGVIGAYTFPDSVADTRVIGVTSYNRKKVGTYGTLWFNTTNGQYFYEVNQTAVNSISSAGEFVENFTVSQSSFTSSGNTTVSSTRSFTFKVSNRQPAVIRLTGKTGSTYVREYVRNIPLADRSYTGDWEIRVEKLTTESDANLFVSMNWESFQCITTDSSLKYDNLAVLRGLGASSNQFSSIPTFSGVYAGKLVRVPTNYEPITRVYSGIWNGTFKTAYTDNPAWCLYDLLVDTNYGFKKHYPDLVVDKWSFYEAAQWCDVLVPRAGTTGYQPRYTYNDLIDQTRAGLEAAQYIASIFGGILTTDLNGTVRLKLDKPGTPVQIFGPESVTVEGFQYQFADMTSRANDMTVTFINPELNWAQDVRQVSIPSYIEANGRIPMDFVAVGCIDPYEAQRRAQIRLLAANTEITTVNFTTTRPGMLLEPYDIIGIVDPDMNWGLSGRIKSAVNGVITLRDPLFLTAGLTYNMTVQSKNGPVELVVQNSGGPVSTQLVRVSGNLLQDIPQNAQFALTSDSIGLVKPFRVISIQEVEGNPDLFSISGVEINMNKYGDADNMTASPNQRYAFENSAIPATPQNVQLESGTSQLYITSAGVVQARIKVSWDQDPQSFVEEYEVYYRRIDRDAYSKVVVNGTDAYIPNVQEGIVYQIYVRAVNILGRRSPPTAVFSHTVVGKDEPPSTPTNLVTSQIDSDVRLDWDDVPDLDINFYEIRIGGTSWETATRIGTSKSSVFTHANVSSGTITYRIKAIDTSGNYSTSALTQTHYVPFPGQPTLTVSLAGPDYVVRITPPFGQAVPIKEYVLRLDSVEIFRGVSTSFSGRVDWVGSKTFEVVAINSANQESNPFTANLTINAPSTLTVTNSFSEGNAVLSWNIPAGSLPIDRYIVRNVTANAILDDDLKATTFILPVDWTGTRQVGVRAVDSAGNSSTETIVSLTIVAPQVQNLQSRLFRSNLELTWSGIPGTLPIKQYRVHLGDTFMSSTYYLLGIPGEDQNNSIVATLSALNWSTPVDWNGTRSYFVIAEDIMGNLSAPTFVTETVDPPLAPTVSATIVDRSIRLEWPETVSELRVREYEIYRDGALVQKVAATTALVPINFSGIKTYRVRAIDEAGNIGAFGDTTINIIAPGTFTFTGVIVGEELRLSWTTPAGSLPISEYEIVRGASNTLVTRVSANSFTLKANWVGSETFKITAYDIAGNASVQQTTTLTVTAPSAPVVRPEILDNNVLLRWTQGTGTLPVISTEIRRGATFATAEVLQQIDATFAAFFEFSAGSYTYWLVNIDSAGNYGTPTSTTVFVSQPPDFILQADFDSTLSGTKTLVLSADDKLYFGVDPTQTYEQHFTADGFASPQAQITAGFPLFLQPNNSGNASYQEEFDYGAVLASSLITITPTVETIAGNATIAVDIEARASTGDAWTTVATGTNQGFASNFRYIRFTLRMVKDSRDDLLAVSRINIRLNSKLKTDSGQGTANSADSTGTQVNFNVDFVDVQSISVQAVGTTARYAIYDFVDVPYPTNFKVYLYDTDGNRVSGNFTWNARGF